MHALPFSCTEAKNIDLVNYLKNLGFSPAKIMDDDYWYLSPLREENTPSFKVNRKKNVWYDFGTGEGGTIIDFGTRYHHCTISELLKMCSSSFSFHQPPAAQKPELAGQKKKIRVIAATSITSPALCRYLQERKIPLEGAQKYCREVHYDLYGQHYYAIGFQNNSGGYELRNAYFKGSVAPKDVTLFTPENTKTLAVFEGFFSFLSFLEFQKKNNSSLTKMQSNYLILNSLSFLKRSKNMMEKHDRIHLFLDRDQAGNKATVAALSWGSQYTDHRTVYEGYKDFNDMLVHKNQSLKPIKRIGRRL